MDYKDTIGMLQQKLYKLEQLVALKDQRIVGGPKSYIYIYKYMYLYSVCVCVFFCMEEKSSACIFVRVPMLLCEWLTCIRIHTHEREREREREKETRTYTHTYTHTHTHTHTHTERSYMCVCLCILKVPSLIVFNP